MRKNIYVKPETEVIAAFIQEHILRESKYYIKGDFDDVEIIKGAWGEGFDNGDGGDNGGLDIDSKDGSNMWDGWDD